MTSPAVCAVTSFSTYYRFQNQIAALIIVAGGIRLPTIYASLHSSVEVVEAVVGAVAAIARLIGQVHQGATGISSLAE